MSLFFNIGFFWQRLPDFFGFSKFRFLGITCEIFRCFSKWGFLGSDFPMIGVFLWCQIFRCCGIRDFPFFKMIKTWFRFSDDTKLFDFAKLKFSGMEEVTKKTADFSAANVTKAHALDFPRGFF
jgi:hypothetical protein